MSFRFDVVHTIDGGYDVIDVETGHTVGHKTTLWKAKSLAAEFGSSKNLSKTFSRAPSRRKDRDELPVL